MKKQGKATLQLRSRESLKSGIRRIARSQINAAIHILKGKETPEIAVHEARKSLKKIRATLQLVASEFGRKQFCTEKKCFHDASQLLAPLRDADVKFKTLDLLLKQGGFESEGFAHMRGELQATAERLARNASRPKSGAVKILRLAYTRVQQWPLDGLNWKHLEREIRQTYRKGRKALKVYHQKQTLETFHAWRKRVKELWYHLRIVEKLLPKAVAEWITLTGEIGEITGNARDLARLREMLLADKSGEKTSPLIDEIEARLPELQRAALKRGAHLYAEKPSDFAKRLLTL